ncbi:hypothetical protein [Vogesella urethralis]|uniref:hypothetical protein n=1 Tax=Vogesella urethralis TaxID=2592656 RepID=UPI00118650F9|nr:hypothetical protein [Vogesella urethralis]
MMPIHNIRSLARQLPAGLPLLAAALASWWLVATATQLLAPSAPALRTLDMPQPQAAAGSVAQQAWFGSSQQAVAQAAPPLQVLGVLGGGHGSQQDFAIVLENGQMLPLRMGEQSPGGWWLRKVDGRGIVIQQQGGGEVRVALERTPATAVPQTLPATSSSMVPISPPQQTVPVVPPQYLQAAPVDGSQASPPRAEPINKD